MLRAVRGLVMRATATIFGVLSAIRGARIFHPKGAAFEATVEIEPTGPAYGVPLLDTRAAHPAVVRLSRGAGLPEPAPDILGVAIRLTDVHGAALHQDLLLASSRERPGVRHLMVPAPGFAGHLFSSILLYRVGDQQLLIGARTPAGAVHTIDEATAAAEAGDLRFELLVAPVFGRWRRVGTVSVRHRLPQAASEALRFNPWNTGGGIMPAGPLQRLRRAAYPASQAARPT
ncbi:MAG TPA: hypothetical protein VEZ46_09720 [Mycobacteriales bacterium]|nr:hypothetical protein [Mycobacteriales bacterium]